MALENEPLVLTRGLDESLWQRFEESVKFEV